MLKKYFKHLLNCDMINICGVPNLSLPHPKAEYPSHPSWDSQRAFYEWDAKGRQNKPYLVEWPLSLKVGSLAGFFQSDFSEYLKLEN